MRFIKSSFRQISLAFRCKMCFNKESTFYPGVAQLVAHMTGGHGVASSSLVTRTKKTAQLRRFQRFCAVSFLCKMA